MYTLSMFSSSSLILFPGLLSSSVHLISPPSLHFPFFPLIRKAVKGGREERGGSNLLGTAG